MTNRDHELEGLHIALKAATTEEERMRIGREIAAICRAGIVMDEDERRCDSLAAAQFEEMAYGSRDYE